MTECAGAATHPRAGSCTVTDTHDTTALPTEALAGAGELAARHKSLIHNPLRAVRARSARRAEPAGTEHDATAVVAFERGERLEDDGELSGAIAAYAEADARGHAAAACNLGILLEQRGEPASAQAAYARADRRGDANGAFNLGILLQEHGHRDHAIAAFRRADQRGHAGAACNLGVALEEQGDLRAAASAYQRAANAGDARGAFNLGLLREHEGDVGGAEAAYRGAAQGDDWIAEMANGARLRLPAPGAGRGRRWWEGRSRPG
jgi:TPR repeat protein